MRPGVSILILLLAISLPSNAQLCVVLGETVAACESLSSEIITQCEGYLIPVTEGQTCPPKVQSYSIFSDINGRLHVVSSLFVGVAPSTMTLLQPMGLMAYV